MEHQTPTLESLLQSWIPNTIRPSLRTSAIPSLLRSIADIAQALRSSQVSQVGTANAFGDDQLNVDVTAENIIRSALTKCASIQTASSEEDPVERQVHSDTPETTESSEVYTVAFDPLDGSSIIAPNWSVGTIIGIWDGRTAIDQNPEKQIAAILGVYGPRTTAFVALRLPESPMVCFEIGYAPDGSMHVVRPDVRLKEPPFKTKYFAPANMRAAAEDENYMQLINYYISQKYTLRYSGGLVPDVVHALVKGHGIYVSPVTQQSKAKLRKLFELAPVALIIECAGGLAIDSATGERILETTIAHTDERGGLVCGNTDEVVLVKQRLTWD